MTEINFRNPDHKDEIDLSTYIFIGVTIFLGGFILVASFGYLAWRYGGG